MSATATAFEAAHGNYLGLAARLVEIGRDLLGQGLLPYEIEGRLYQLLTAGAPRLQDPVKARRVRLFQAMMGLPGPLPRDEASALATAVWRALRGPPDRGFERQTLLACLLNNLVQAAHDEAERLRHDGCAVTFENLKSALMIAVVNARPRSSIVPWHLSDQVVEKTIIVAADFYLGAV